MFMQLCTSPELVNPAGVCPIGQNKGLVHTVLALSSGLYQPKYSDPQIFLDHLPTKHKAAVFSF